MQVRKVMIHFLGVPFFFQLVITVMQLYYNSERLENALLHIIATNPIEVLYHKLFIKSILEKLPINFCIFCKCLGLNIHVATMFLKVSIQN